MRLTGGTICGGNGCLRDRDLVIRNGRIALEPAGAESGRQEETTDVTGLYILPGFIEIHTHGAGLFEFTMGRYRPADGGFDRSEAVYSEEFPRYTHLRALTGTTGLYLGTWASPVEQQQFCFRQLRRYMESAGNGRDGARILGGLLEGMFFNPAKAGAQNPAYVLKPDIDLFNRVNESGVIRLVNVVPEYDELGNRLIEYLTKKGISVGAGHTEATAEQFKRSIDKGLKYVIHFLNGPIGGSFKAFNGGGGIEAVLREDIFAEIIMDGIHVAPWYVRDVLKRKGVDRVMTVTDVMFSSQAEGVKEFTINGITGQVDDGGQFVKVKGKPSLTLFSSLLTMDRALGNLVSWLTVPIEGVWNRHEAMTLEEAVTTAGRCAATNIAAMLKLHGGDDLESGEIKDGNWADLVVAELTGQPGDYRLEVKQTFVRGARVF